MQCTRRGEQPSGPGLGLRHGPVSVDDLSVEDAIVPTGFDLTRPKRLGLLCLIVFGVGLLTLTGSWRASPDSVFYLSTSWSLAHGEGYSFLGRPFTKYPAGLPLLLAPLVRACGFQFLLLHAYLWLWAVTGIYFMGRWVRARWGPQAATWLVLLVTTNYFFWAWSCNFLMGEAPYFALSMMALCAADRWMRRPGVGHSVVLGALMLVAIAVRVPGLALLAGLAGAAVLAPGRVDRRRWLGAAAICLVVGGAFAGWQAYVLAYSPPGADHYLREWQLLGSAYTGQLASATDVARWIGHLLEHNWITHSRNILWIMAGSPFLPEQWYVPAAVVLGMVFVGLVDGVVRRRAFADCYLAAYVAMFFLWPYNERTRFWMPVLPLLMMSFVHGLGRVGALLRADGVRWRRVAQAVVVVAYLACLPGMIGVALRHPGPAYGGAQVLFLRWVAAMIAIGYLGAGVWLLSRLRGAASARPVGRWAWRAVVAGLVVLCLNNLAAIAYRTHLKHRNYAAQNKGIAWAQHLGTWLRANTPPDAVVAAAKCNVMVGVYGNRRVLALEGGGSAVATGAHYLVALPDELTWLEPAANRHDVALRPVYQSGHHVLFRLEHLRASRAPSSPAPATQTGT